jgi:hypothetical protein
MPARQRHRSANVSFPRISQDVDDQGVIMADTPSTKGNSIVEMLSRCHGTKSVRLVEHRRRPFSPYSADAGVNIILVKPSTTNGEMPNH